MSKDGSSVKMARSGEPEAVRTTIVGGRPPGGGAIPREIPRGLEVLVKKAAVDPAFKDILFEKRAGAAEAIGLKLTAAEEAMLAAVPLAQLEGIVAHTRISPKLKPVFLGYAAGAMLAVLGTATLECTSVSPDETNPAERKNAAASAPKNYRGRYVNPPNPGRQRKPTSHRPNAGITGILANSVSAGRDLDGIVSGVGGLGARPDIPPDVRRDRNSPTTVIRKRVSVSAPAPSSVDGTGANRPERAPCAIAAVVRRHLAGIENAYRTALKENPGLGSGRIVVRFTILARGEVESVTLERDTVGNASLSNSLISRIRSWRFPPVERGKTTVEYTFVFIAEEGSYGNP